MVRDRVQNLEPPILQPALSNYPVHIQVCRVTSSVGASSSGTGGSSPFNIYSALTQQFDSGTLSPRDREQCFVYDINGLGLVAGYYVCRLVGSLSGLPLYETQQFGSRGPCGTLDEEFDARVLSYDGYRYYTCIPITWTAAGAVNKTGAGTFTAIDANGLQLVTTQLPNPIVRCHQAYRDSTLGCVYVAELSNDAISYGVTTCFVGKDCNGNQLTIDVPQNWVDQTCCVDGGGGSSSGSGCVNNICCSCVTEFCLTTSGPTAGVRQIILYYSGLNNGNVYTYGVGVLPTWTGTLPGALGVTPVFTLVCDSVYFNIVYVFYTLSLPPPPGSQVASPRDAFLAFSTDPFSFDCDGITVLTSENAPPNYLIPGNCGSGGSSGSPSFCPSVAFNSADVCVTVGTFITVTGANFAAIPSENTIDLSSGVAHCVSVNGAGTSMVIQIDIAPNPNAALTMGIVTPVCPGKPLVMVQIGYAVFCLGCPCDPEPLTSAPLYFCVTDTTTGECWPSITMTYDGGTSGTWTQNSTSFGSLGSFITSAVLSCQAGQYQMVMNCNGRTSICSPTVATCSPFFASGPLLVGDGDSRTLKISDSPVTCCAGSSSGGGSSSSGAATWIMEFGTINGHTPAATFTPSGSNTGTTSSSGVLDGGSYAAALAYRDRGTNHNTESVTFTYSASDGGDPAAAVGTRWNHATQEGCIGLIRFGFAILYELGSGSWALIQNTHGAGLALTDGHTYTMTISDDGTTVTLSITDDSWPVTCSLTSLSALASNSEVSFGWATGGTSVTPATVITAVTP